MIRSTWRVARLAIEAWGVFWLAVCAIEWIADTDNRRRRARHLNEWDRRADERRARDGAR